MESTENTFETALSSLSALTTHQAQLKGAPHLLKATQNLIAEKLTTLALTCRVRSPSSSSSSSPSPFPSDQVEYLPSLATIYMQLQKSNIDPGQMDTIIDNQLQALQRRLDTTSRADMVEYTALLETRRILATNAIGFRFYLLDAVIRRVAGMLCEEAVVANKALSSTGKEIPETPLRAEPAKGLGGAQMGAEASALTEMVDVDPSQGVTASKVIPPKNNSSDEDMSSPIRPREESISLSDAKEDLSEMDEDCVARVE